MDLNTFWFVLLGILLTGYAVLDGFDLGVGTVHLFARRDEDRRLFLNAIGPLWDGNEVWLVTFGGALFAAFPEAYATALSGFYAAFMIVLFALIFRAVSIEFRSKTESKVWRSFWDVSFSGGSVVAAIVFGMAVGNSILGIPMGANHEYEGGLPGLLRPYGFLVGFLTVAVFAMHGCAYLALKVDGELREKVRQWTWPAFALFLVLYLLTTIYTLVRIPSAARYMTETLWGWPVVLLNVLAVCNIPRALYRGRAFEVFASSSAAIIALTLLFGFALFPNLIVSSTNPAWNLTIYNAASSRKTLEIMRIVAFIGMPFVLTYTAIVYWVFRGKVKIEKSSY